MLPTLNALRDAGAAVSSCSHLGRPKGAPDPKYTLAPVADAARRAARHRRSPSPTDTVGDVGRRPPSTALADGQVAAAGEPALQPGETSKDDAERGAFADQLAALADVYVDDAFGAVHRKHASVYDVPARLPHYAGGLVLREVEVLRG